MLQKQVEALAITIGSSHLGLLVAGDFSRLLRDKPMGIFQVTGGLDGLIDFKLFALARAGVVCDATPHAVGLPCLVRLVRYTVERSSRRYERGTWEQILIAAARGPSPPSSLQEPSASPQARHRRISMKGDAPQ